MTRFALLALLTACSRDIVETGKPADTGDSGGTIIGDDEDGDGWVPSEGDCDDSNADIYPGAAELCDGVDNNCDDAIDEGVENIFYTDADGDGYGDPDGLAFSCEAPDDAVENNDDCDDTDASTFPGAPEPDCDDPVDRNCDGSVGGDDVDEDGWSACVDCDDADGAVSPDAPETCNEVDDDCDGEIDETGSEGETTWYYDGDSDGYGNPTATASACDAPDGYTAVADDCNDGAALASPAGTETCDGLDNDCDGDTDEDGASTWYYDADGDGYGDASVTADACTAPAGYVAASADCDDGDVSVSPAAVEACDEIDNDCDGDVDESGAATFYADADGDGYGDPSVVTTGCTLPAGYASSADDCDDAVATVNPAATETCDGVDEDCDGTVDNDAGVTWYVDADGDGYGTAGSTTTSCSAPAGYAATDDDCDDSSSSYSPGSAEVCDDGLDQDCDGTADDDCPDTVTHCGTISADETWDGEDLHVITCDVFVNGSANPLLTIEDGATVEFAPGTALYVGWYSYGELWVDGHTEGVTLTSDDSRPGAGDWDGLVFGGYDRGSWLEGASISYGGGGGYGNIYAVNTSLLTVVDSEITDSSESGIYLYNSTLDLSGTGVSDNADYGVYLDTYYSALATTGGATFTDNTISGNGSYPLTVPAAYVGALDASNTLTGNVNDAVYVYAGTVSSTTTWYGLDVPYYIAGDVTFGAAAGMVMTIADGAELQFASGAGLSVGSGSYVDFVVDGATTGVTFTSSRTTPRAGDWDGLYFGPYVQLATIDGATISYGGANGYGNVYAYSNSAPVEISDSTISDSSTSGVYLSWYASASIHDSLLSDNADYGLYVFSAAELDGDLSFTGNTVTTNDVGVSVPAQEAGALGDDGTYTGNTSDDVEMQTDTIATDTTVRALDAYWHVTGDVTVGGSARPVLTVEDGAELRFEGSAGLYVGTGSYGSLDVQGSTQGVIFTSAEATPAAGDWDGIQISWYSEGATLAGCEISYGGGNGYANLYLYPAGYYGSGSTVVDDCVIRDSSGSGIDMRSTDEVAISDTEISDNATYGLYMDTNSDLETAGGPTFTGNTVTGNGLYPVVLPVTSLAQLDSSSSFTGNGTDRVYVDADTVGVSSTWQALDAPYFMNGDTWIQGSTSPVVTIEAGATFLFNYYATIWVGPYSYGELVAVGTTAAPIVFTSAESSPLPGDWDGLAFHSYDTGSTLQNVEVSYGGGYYGNVYLYNNASLVSILDSTVSNSESYGIYRNGSASPTISGVTYASNASGDLY